MRAVSMNPDSSRLAGISVGRTLMIGWGIAALAGALAGMLIAPRLFLDVNFMGAVLIYSFAAATLGRLRQPAGRGDRRLDHRRGREPGRHLRRLDRQRPEDPGAAADHPGGADGAPDRAVRLAGGLAEHEARRALRRPLAVVLVAMPFFFTSYRVGPVHAGGRVRGRGAGPEPAGGLLGPDLAGPRRLVRAGRVRQRDPDHRRRLSRLRHRARWPRWSASARASCSACRRCACAACTWPS